MNELGYMEREIRKMQESRIEPELFTYLVVDTKCLFWTFAAEDIDHAIEQYDNMGEDAKVKAVFVLASTEEFYHDTRYQGDLI